MSNARDDETRGQMKRRMRREFIARALSCRGRVINGWSAARRRNWNGKGKLKGGAKDIDWTAELTYMRLRGYAG